MTVIDTSARRVLSRAGTAAAVNPRFSRRKRLAFLLLTNLLVLAGVMIVGELAFRLLWNPRYWIHTGQLGVFSGQTEAGKKWWPSTTYRVDGSEFHTDFRTNAEGYRSRTAPSGFDHPTRVAFVGDSFTEAMQVAYDDAFCARLERLLNASRPGRPIECVNYGVSATDVFDYWHRIVHDVLAENPPEALVLCIYPGNDFQPTPPAGGFDRNGEPLRDYYPRPGWSKHLVAWINLHSKFGCYLQRALLSWDAAAQRPDPRLKNWWADPGRATELRDEPALKRYRSLLAAIDQECRRKGTRLAILVVGPVANYSAKDGQSPLSIILSRWGIDVPVIDVAIRARARQDWPSLVFPFDGHLTETGHEYIARQAIEPLSAFMDGQESTARR